MNTTLESFQVGHGPRAPGAGRVLVCVFALFALCLRGDLVRAQAWVFTDATVEAGLTVGGAPVEHGFIEGSGENLQGMTGGAAAGDYNRDGLVDLYIVRGNIGPNLLFRNLGNGTFDEVGAAAGVDYVQGAASGPRFADLDGDGWQDLIVGGFGTRNMTVYRNRRDGTFEDVTVTSGIQHAHATFSIACADYDSDGDVDVYTSHWGCPPAPVGHLWRNNGDWTFTDVDDETNVTNFTGISDWTFTPNFADITNDGRPDLVIASDFETSQVFHNDGQGGFVESPLGVASPDENGMGATVGDYDNDLDLDWFVTSVWDFDQFPESNWGVTGNRMYQNQGDGTFVDATDVAGVREGDWGWGATFGDLNNDGWLDIFMVNGWHFLQFANDPARLFVNDGDGTFTERGAELGMDDDGQGRGVVCLDYDDDGDLDLLICNNTGPLRLMRNELASTASFAKVRLMGEAPNTQALGARIYVTANGMTQMRELRAGSNYVSSNDVGAHFGLGSATTIDQLRIVWPDGSEDVHTDVEANTQLTYYQSPTPVHVSEFSAVSTQAGVLLSWQVSNETAVVYVQRSAALDGPFHDIARLEPDTTGRMSHLDSAPFATDTRWYRLMLEDSDGVQRAGPTVWVDGIAARADAELLWARGDADAVRIRYSVSGAPADVRLEIFDVRGRRVATPLSEARPAGVWTLEWPARSDTGQRLSHGLYFVRLRTPFVSRQVKLTLAPR